jgi:superfamily II DNA helicase RecQ
LKARGVNAESLNSKISAKLKKTILNDLNSEKPNLKLLYITPELGKPNLINKNNFLNDKNCVFSCSRLF